MKTTLDLPDDLYLATKSRAVAQKRKIKDLIAQGLETVLASDPSNTGDLQEAQRQTLDALDEILRCPPSPKGRTKHLKNEVRTLRSEGWSRS